MEPSSAKLQNALSTAGLQRLQPDIERLLRLSIRLTATPSDGPLPTGSSHLGGQPDLPTGFAWPIRGDLPMSFLAQVRLEELASFPPAAVLPTTGLLSFFYDSKQETYGADPADRGGWQVVYLAGSPASWQRQPFPEALPGYAQFSVCSLEFSVEASLPSSPSQHLPDLDWSEAELQAYEEFLFAYPGAEERARPHHRMFGHPDQIQDDMQLQCALYANGFTDLDDPQAAAALARKEDWLLLLQLDSDAQAGMKWASAGRLYYWIEAEALQAGQFDQAWVVLQSD